jgi:catechol 2,3-dioxygenase-like lactoylglutathione lyase family enzyme
MTEETKPLIVKVETLFQCGIIVRDVEKTARMYETLFGITDWVIYDPGPYIETMTYKGKQVEDPHFIVGTAQVGPVEIELIQPVSEDTPYADFLKEHGEGLQHMGHVHTKDLAASLRALEAQGFPCDYQGDAGATKFAYVDMTAALGTVVELVQMPGEE